MMFERYRVVPTNDQRDHSTESDKPCWGRRGNDGMRKRVCGSLRWTTIHVDFRVKRLVGLHKSLSLSLPV